MHSLVPRKLLQKLSFFTAVFEKKNEYPLSSFRIYFLSCPNEELYWLRFLMTEKESLPQHTIRVASCFPVPSFSLTVTTRLFAGHTRCGTQFRELFCLWDASSSSFSLSLFSRLKREFSPFLSTPSRSPSLLALSLSFRKTSSISLPWEHFGSNPLSMRVPSELGLKIDDNTRKSGLISGLCYSRSALFLVFSPSLCGLFPADFGKARAAFAFLVSSQPAWPSSVSALWKSSYARTAPNHDVL